MRTLLLLVLLPVFALGQSPEAQAERLRLNMVQPELSVLQEILANDLVYGHSSGLIDDKAALIAQLTGGSFRFLSITISDQSVKTWGKVAVIRHLLRAQTEDRGIAGEIHLKVLQVWRKTDGRWRLQERQAVRYTPG